MTVKSSRISSWNHDRAEVCAAIRGTTATLKIVLKTKDEVFFLEKWIRHHLPITDGAPLLIFDNMSTAPEVLAVYEKYAESLLVVRFEDGVDDLHDVARFRDLYDSLADSALFMTVMDTDEFLYLYDGTKLTAGGAVPEYLRRNGRVAAFAPSWLNNLSFREDAFFFNGRKDAVAAGFHQGKTILSAAAYREHAIPCLWHNAFMPKSVCNETTPTAFAQLHLCNLSLKQRIRANMRKLVSMGAVAHEKDFSGVFALDPAAAKLNVSVVARQTRAILEGHFGLESDEYLTVTSGGNLVFHPPDLESVFRRCFGPEARYGAATHGCF